ncbi:pentapeptide repeat-containing protein [Oceanisphaera litoralis]|uniref:pentapeptide repeat-containing protein n=1 Tax=Oceanisphaera litoralis TaxID=225144 RepID=UPI003B835901
MQDGQQRAGFVFCRHHYLFDSVKNACLNLIHIINLVKANLVKANLVKANLVKANLVKADLVKTVMAAALCVPPSVVLRCRPFLAECFLSTRTCPPPKTCPPPQDGRHGPVNPIRYAGTMPWGSITNFFATPPSNSA